MTAVDWLLSTFKKRSSLSRVSTLSRVSMITSRIAKTVTNTNADTFRHPILSDEDHNEGCKLGIDTWAETCCAGKHAYVEKIR